MPLYKYFQNLKMQFKTEVKNLGTEMFMVSRRMFSIFTNMLTVVD